MDTQMSTEVTPQPITRLEPHRDNIGCWVDGVRGWQAIGHMIYRAAGELQYPLSIPDREAVDAYMFDGIGEGDLDIVAEIAREAEDWLNEHVAPAGYSFGWHDGDWFLQSGEWWDEDY